MAAYCFFVVYHSTFILLPAALKPPRFAVLRWFSITTAFLPFALPHLSCCAYTRIITCCYWMFLPFTTPRFTAAHARTPQRTLRGLLLPPYVLLCRSGFTTPTYRFVYLRYLPGVWIYSRFLPTPLLVRCTLTLFLVLFSPLCDNTGSTYLPVPAAAPRLVHLVPACCTPPPLRFGTFTTACIPAFTAHRTHRHWVRSSRCYLFRVLNRWFILPLGYANSYCRWFWFCCRACTACHLPPHAVLLRLPPHSVLVLPFDHTCCAARFAHCTARAYGTQPSTCATAHACITHWLPAVPLHFCSRRFSRLLLRRSFQLCARVSTLYCRICVFAEFSSLPFIWDTTGFAGSRLLFAPRTYILLTPIFTRSLLTTTTCSHHCKQHIRFVDAAFLPGVPAHRDDSTATLPACLPPACHRSAHVYVLLPPVSWAILR